MAIHRGRGIAAIEYPTGMNQNGDPSQAWIKLKLDGRVDVFAGTVDIGQGSKTVHTQIVADTLGVPYDWVTMDTSNTDSSAFCMGTFASRGTFIGGNAVRLAAEKVKSRILDIAGKTLEIDPADLEIVDGEVIAKGMPDKKMGVPDVAGAATFVYGELISGEGTALKPYATVDPEDGQVTIPPHSAISYAACVADVEVDDETGNVRVLKMSQVYDVGRAINPTLIEGQIEGGADHGPRARRARELLPVLPERRPSRRPVRLVPGAVHGGAARPRDDPDREPVGRRPVRRQGDRRDGQQRPAAGDRDRHLQRHRRVGDRAADHARAGAARARRQGRGPGEPRREGKVVIFDERHLAERARPRRRVDAVLGVRRDLAVPDVERRRAARDPPRRPPDRHRRRAGAAVPRHLRPRQAVRLHATRRRAGDGDLDGSVDMTIEGETKTLVAGDVVVVNRGLEHELYSAGGVTFFEALGPVPLDHVPDRERDLVLGPDNGAGHVER